MEDIKKRLLREIADIESIPQGAYNIRVDGKCESSKSTADIEVLSLKNGDGLEVHVKDGVKNQSVHIPVIIAKAGLKETVYNQFYIGENCDITIVAGCGIHVTGCGEAQHNGVHTFYVGKNSKVRYIEKHIAYGDIKAKKSMNPSTNVYLDKNASFLMETFQYNGLDQSERKTSAVLQDGASIVVKESISTNKKQVCNTHFDIELEGVHSSADVKSRSVAQDSSRQKFVSKVTGKKECFGHVECDAIIRDKAQVSSVPEINALSQDASLIHEAVIGKLAPEQVTKLMTLGLTEEEAVDTIIQGFLN